MFDGRGLLKVTDFGIARGDDVEVVAVDAPRDAAFFGTPAYASPEQARHALGDTDAPIGPATDQYSLALVTYEALCGELSHSTAGGVAALFNRRIREDARPLRDIKPGIPRDIETVVMRGLAREPTDRYPTIQDFADALEAAARVALGDDLELSSDVVPASRSVASRGGSPSGLVTLPNNLPLFRTSLVGRQTELAELRRLVGAHRLVTLTGPGGAGKTRLALQTAAGLLDGTGDGVWFVDLAPVDDPDQVAATIARVLDLHDVTSTRAIDALRDAVGDRNVLFVLDNCEHVITAAAEVANALVRDCPGVDLIATSREPLGIEGEVVFRVASLSVPSDDATLEAIAASSSVQLFVERARSQHPGFAVDAINAPDVASVVRRLDGIPLALELAAARLRSLTVSEIAERLDQRFRILTTGMRSVARQQTLRAAIDWSYELLGEDEREALRRASVFAGGFELSAAESVLANGTTIDALDVVDLVDRLIDKSLLQYDPTSQTISRYRLLETIREYAAERSAEASSDALDDLRRAHLGYYCDFAERAGAELRGSHQVEWDARLRADHDNLVAALATAVAFDDCTELGLRLAASIDRYWHIHGHGAAIARHLRALCERDGAPRSRCAGFALLQSAECAAGRASDGLGAAESALGLARDLDDARLMCLAVRSRSAAEDWLGDSAASLDDARRALEYAMQTDDFAMRGEAHHTIAVALNYSGDPVGARDASREAIESFRRAGDLFGEACELVNLADCELQIDDGESAAIHLAAAEPLLERLDIPDLNCMFHQNLGLAATNRGSASEARDHFAEAVRVSGRAHRNDTLALGLTGYAYSVSTTDPDLAATLLAGAQAILDHLGVPLPANEQRLADDVSGAPPEGGAPFSPAELIALVASHQSVTETFRSP
jgi:predicted ATPase